MSMNKLGHHDFLRPSSFLFVNIIMAIVKPSSPSIQKLELVFSSMWGYSTNGYLIMTTYVPHLWENEFLSYIKLHSPWIMSEWSTKRNKTGTDPLISAFRKANFYFTTSKLLGISSGWYKHHGKRERANVSVCGKSLC